MPEYLLKNAKIAAINFHPAPPEYPGIGCNNFALYENAQYYGVTCHHMNPKADTGKIVAVQRFAIFESDNVRSLLSRTYDFQLALFYEIAAKILTGGALPESSENWSRKPFTRKEFNELFKITIDMDAEEIARRVRATDYLSFKPAINIGGYEFELKTK